MTTPSQFDPLAQAPSSFLARIRRTFGRKVEPLAVNLLAWCRSLDHRVGSVEGRLEGDEAQIRSLSHAVRNIESLVPALEAAGELGSKVSALARRATAAEAKIESLNTRAETAIKSLEARADQAYWGREALVERMNRDDAREDGLAQRLAAVEERAEQLMWGREALVERMNHDDAAAEVLGREVADLKVKVDEQVPLPLAFGLDYLAMGRRLAAIEDQIEALLVQFGKAGDGPAASLVAFPAPGMEKAAG